MKITREKNVQRFIALLLVFLCLLQLFSIDSYALTQNNGKMWYSTDSGSFNIKGYHNGSLLQTTYGNNGYNAYLMVDSSESSALRFTSNNSPYTYQGVQITQVLSYVSGGNYVKIEYIVKNTTSSSKSISLGVDADIQIGSNDYAPIENLSGNRGVRMYDGSSQFMFIGRDSYGVTNVDTYWFGDYNIRTQNRYTNRTTYHYGSGGRQGDSGMAWSWKNRTIRAGQTQTYSVLIGIGELNDPPTISLTSTFKNFYYENEEVLITGRVNDINTGDRVTVKYAVDNGTEYEIPQVFIPNGVSKNFSATFRIPSSLSAGVHNLKVWAVDDKGNMSIPATANFTVAVDKTAPTGSHTLTPSTWTSGSVTINVTGTDGQSGMQRIKLPSGSYVNSSTGSYTVSSNGTYTFVLEDKVGNTNQYKVTVTNIDKVAPTITLSGTPTSWTKGNVTISASASDSGIGVYRIKLPNGNYVNNSQTTYVVSSNGTYTFEAEDHLGNKSSKSISITNIDKVVPTASHEIVLVSEGEYKVVINATDNLSGVKRIKLPNGSYSSGSSAEYNVENNKEYYFVIEDNAGNTRDYLVVAKIPSLLVYQKGDHVQTEWLTEVVGDKPIDNVEEYVTTEPGEDVSVLPSSIEYNSKGYTGLLYPQGLPEVISGQIGATKNISSKVGPQEGTTFPMSLNYNQDGFTGTMNKNGSYYQDGAISDSKNVIQTETSYTNSFPNTLEYDVSGYVGTLTKKGSALAIAGEYEPADTKVITEKRQTGIGESPGILPNTIPYSYDRYEGVLRPVGEAVVVSGSAEDTKTVTAKRTSTSQDDFPFSFSYSEDGYMGTLVKDGNPYQDGAHQLKALAEGYITNGTNDFPSTMAVDTQGYTGNIPKDGESFVIDGTYTPDEVIEMTETAQAENKEDLPTMIIYWGTGGSMTPPKNVILYVRNDGFDGNLYPVGQPKLITGSAESKNVTKSVQDNYIRPTKEQGPDTIPYSENGFKGTLSRKSTTYRKEPGSIEVQLTGSHFSTQPNIEMDIDGMMAKAKKLLESAPYNYTGITFERWEWQGSEQGPGSYYLSGEDGHLNEGDSSIEYKYKRMSSIYVKVDGYVYTSTYEGTVNKPSTNVWEQTYSGRITKAGIDTRVWRQNYKGEVSKDVPIYAQNYKGNVSKPDTRVWEKTYSGEVTKPEIDTRIWRQEYEGEVVKSTPLYSQDYSGIAERPDTRVWRQKYAGVVKKEVTTDDRSELYRNNSLIYNGYDTEYEDFVATDKTAPNKIISYDLQIKNGNVDLSLTRPEDVGTSYQYQVRGINTDGNKSYSNIEDITITSGVKGYSYVIDKNASTVPNNVVNTIENKISTTITDNSKYYIHIRVVDNKGNASETVHIPYQDNVSPTMTLTQSPTEWTKGNVVINATALDSLSGVRRIKLPNGSYSNGSTAEYSVSTNGTYTFVAEDYAGNTVSKSITISNIDKTPPSKPSISANTNWTNASAVPVTIIGGTDSQSGVNRSEYKLEGATVQNWTTYTGVFNITKEGITKISARTVDNLGHISEVVTLEVKIDRVAPHATSIQINNDAEYTNSRTVTLSLSALDNASGVAQMQFKNEDGSWSTAEAYETSKSWTLSTGDGIKTVWVRYKDNAGNWSDPISDTIKLDMSAPVTSKFVIQDDVPYYNSHSVYLTLNIYDSLSGIKEVYISNDNSTWTTFAYSERISWILTSGDGNKTVYMKVVDNAGNMSSVVSDTIFIDTVNPTGSIVINNGDEQTMSRDVKLRLTFADNTGGSGIQTVRIVEGMSEYKFPTVPSSPTTIDWRLSDGTGVKTVTLVVVDKAGNVSMYSDSIIVDKLSIERFTLTDVVNPIRFNHKTPFTPRVWTFSPQPMLAGGNISFAIDLKTPYDASVVEDSVLYKVEIIGGDYHKVLSGNMEYQLDDHYSKTITIPEDAPKEAKVYVIVTAKRQLLVSPFDLQTVYFPGVEASTKAQIGVIEGNIHEQVKFNEIY